VIGDKSEGGDCDEDICAGWGEPGVTSHLGDKPSRRQSSRRQTNSTTTNSATRVCLFHLSACFV